MTRFEVAVAVVAITGCTASVTTTKEDSYGGKLQTPIGWRIDSGPGKSAILKHPNGAGTVHWHEFPQGPCAKTPFVKKGCLPLETER